MITWLVVEPYPSEKYDFVSWDDDIPNWMESHKIPWFQSPPTSYPFYPHDHWHTLFHPNRWSQWNFRWEFGQWQPVNS
jgi:hypothetical protein